MKHKDLFQDGEKQWQKFICLLNNNWKQITFLVIIIEIKMKTWMQRIFL